MAQFNFKDYLAREQENGQAVPKAGGEGYKVGFFKLSQDGEEAFVRFNYKSTDEFHFASVHEVQTKHGFKRVSCLRESFYEPRENCPFCSSQDESVRALKQKIYVELIRYVKQADGTFKPVAEMWEKPAGFSKELANYLSLYGDLRKYVFSIKRSGAVGDKNTRYLIMALPSEIYTPEAFPIDFSGFEGYDITKHGYYVKSFEDMEEFLATGDFPYKRKDEQASAPAAEAPAKQPQAEADLSMYDEDPFGEQAAAPVAPVAPVAPTSPVAPAYKPAQPQPAPAPMARPQTAARPHPAAQPQPSQGAAAPQERPAAPGAKRPLYNY